ncbi:hypothetical protein Dsin_001338 [Dipteronia sinensis]|uniref:Myb-like domain-containing protein n=1 Tax=Dipteronia sinensis TaxID=43782 RepID=A0AAE0B435_9ROSI|nr:hypothetical protein Dsin_001338 [Dipteronia sinensis]
MGRSPFFSKEGMNMGAWTAMEDKILTSSSKSMEKENGENSPKELLNTGRLPKRTDNEIKNYWNTTLGTITKTHSSKNSPPPPLPPPPPSLIKIKGMVGKRKSGQAIN